MRFWRIHFLRRNAKSTCDNALLRAAENTGLEGRVLPHGWIKATLICRKVARYKTMLESMDGQQTRNLEMKESTKRFEKLRSSNPYDEDKIAGIVYALATGTMAFWIGVKCGPAWALGTFGLLCLGTYGRRGQRPLFHDDGLNQSVCGLGLVCLTVAIGWGWFAFGR